MTNKDYSSSKFVHILTDSFFPWSECAELWLNVACSDWQFLSALRPPPSVSWTPGCGLYYYAPNPFVGCLPRTPKSLKIELRGNVVDAMWQTMKVLWNSGTFWVFKMYQLYMRDMKQIKKSCSSTQDFRTRQLGNLPLLISFFLLWF